MKITFVIPVFNERDTLEPLVEGIAEHVGDHTYRIIAIDDGSTDGSYEKLRELKQRFENLSLVRQRGNFGKSAALATGFALADGDIVITMDSDLQDDPKEIPRFLEKLDEGYDVVCGWKAKRHDPWHKTIPSHIYNRFVSRLFHIPLHDVNCGYKAFRLEVVKKIQIYGEMHRLIPVLAHNLHYKVCEIPVEHHARRYGHSKFGFERFYRGALDVLTVWFLRRYMYSPGHFFGKGGFIQVALAIVAIALAVPVWCTHHSIEAALIGAVGVVLFANGLVFIGLGLFAELLLRHFIRTDSALFTAEEEL